MWHQIVVGTLLGWGAAIPIGPINLEIVRRNLRFGTLFGINLGLGACSADLTYFVLLLTGTLVIFHNTTVMRVIGIVGSVILMWFGVSAIRSRVKKPEDQLKEKENDPVAWHHYLQGYLMTLLNPFTILFWASVSTQLATISLRGPLSAVYVGVGVLIGTVSWIIGFNIILHFTRHRLSSKTIQYLNYIGGIIIIIFAMVGLWHAAI